jgi:hypothetical protein
MNDTRNLQVPTPAQVKSRRATRQFNECQVQRALNLQSVAEVRKVSWRSEAGVQGNALAQVPAEGQE